MAFLKLINVNKEYVSKAGAFKALSDVSFELEKDEFVVILSQSGAGETTLLNILGGMDTLTTGSIYLNDQEITMKMINVTSIYDGFIDFTNLLCSVE